MSKEVCGADDLVQKIMLTIAKEREIRNQDMAYAIRNVMAKFDLAVHEAVKNVIESQERN